MMRGALISVLLVLAGASPAVTQGAEPETTLLLQRITFSESPPAQGLAAIPFTIATPVLHTSFRSSSFVAPAGAERLRDLVPDSARPRTQGLVAASTWLNGRFTTESEVANNSSHDMPSITRIDQRDSTSNRMLRFNLVGAHEQFRYGANYRSAGKAFFNTPDQTVRELWGEMQWGLARFRTSVGEMWNNVDLDPSQARIEQRYSRIGLALAKAFWPELSVSYVRHASTSTYEPAGFVPIRTQSNSLEGAMAYSGRNWNARVASSYIVVADELRAGAESVAVAQAFNGLYRPFNTLTIMPSLTYRTEQQQWSGVRMQTPTASLSLQYKQSQRLLVSAMGGYTSSRSSDHTVNRESIMSRGLFSFHLDPIYGRAAMLSLEAAYTNTIDHASPSLAAEDISGLLRFLLASL